MQEQYAKFQITTMVHGEGPKIESIYSIHASQKR